MLLGIFGDLGSGKTLLASILGQAFYEDGYELYANYRLKNAKIITYNDFVNMKKFYDPDKKYCFVIDEIYAFGMESRVSTSKLNLNIIYTAQLATTVDLRLRTLTDYYIIAKKTPNGFYYFVVKDNGVIKILYLDKKNAQKYFSLYNTREIINPVYGDQNE